MPEATVDRSSISMEEFNDLLTFEDQRPTTHALIVRDEEEVLVYGGRSRNEDGEWEVRGYTVYGPGVKFGGLDVDRADIATIFVEAFDDDELTTDEKHVQRRPVRYGVPTAVAVDGKPAIAAWLFVRGSDHEEIAGTMDVRERTVSEYLSRFRQYGDGVPDDLDIPEPGTVVPEVPPEFDPVPRTA